MTKATSQAVAPLGRDAVRPRRAEGLRSLLIHDHERLEALFVTLLDAFLEGDPEDVRAMWARFAAGLSAHFQAEELHLLPRFAQVAPDEAAGLLGEHALFRGTLDELGVGVDLRSVRLDVARAFVDALRAHARREDALFYRWAEGRGEEAGRSAVARELDATQPGGPPDPLPPQ